MEVSTLTKKGGARDLPEVLRNNCRRMVQRLTDEVIRWTSGQVGSERWNPSRRKGEVELSVF